LNTSAAIDTYRSQSQSLEQQIAIRKLLMQRLVWVRLGLALPGIGLILFGMLEKTASNWTWIAGTALMFGFLAAATWHENNLWVISQLQQRLFGYKRLLARCDRQWASLLPLPTETCTLVYLSDLSRDIDLFGERSLFRWLSLAMTNSGANTICKWMTQWAEPATIVERQVAVRALASDRSWRMRFFETACNYRSQQLGPEGIVEWSQSGNHFAGKKWLHALTWLSPIAVVAGVVGIVIAKAADFELGQVIGVACVLTGAAINFLLTMLIVGQVHEIFVKIGAANRELQSLVEMIRAINSFPSQGKLLSEIQAKLHDQHHSSEVALGRLQRIMALAGMQRSPLLFIPYLLLQVCFLWDIRILELLEGWKKIFGAKAQGWIDAIGMMEALSSAAAIADEYPTWTTPDLLTKEAMVAGQQPLLEAKDVAHPLLKDTSRVPNSLCVRQNQPLLLVTGSNMAGKSTLLRSVGVNAILARVGAPVCAAHWQGASYELASSIQVQDSLQDGVSFFMAELKRLRSVVDMAQQQHHHQGKQMLVLLDEILQGTNSRERQIAVEHVLDKLVEFGCLVLTSTHDLEMAGNQRIQKIAQVVHFREHFETVEGREIMRFDYVMHPGVTPTTNALKLLEMVGLRVQQ